MSPIKTTEDIEKEVIRHENRKLIKINLKKFRVYFHIRKTSVILKLFFQTLLK